MTITFNVINQRMEAGEKKFIASDTVNYVDCRFCFSEDWADFEKTAVFSSINGSYSVLLSGDVCVVPHEVLSGAFNVSVFGTQNGTVFKRITTNAVSISVEESGYKEGETPDEPTPTVYESIMSQAVGNKKQAEAVKESNTQLSAEIEAAKKTAAADKAELTAEIAECSTKISAIETDLAKLPQEYAAKTHTHKAADIVDLNIPTKTSHLENDSNFIADGDYVHTDNNYTDAEKAKLAALYEYDDSEIKAEIDAKSDIPCTVTSGYPITLTDHLENNTLLSCRVYGSESGIGKSDAESGKYKIPLKVIGKNLLEYPYVDSSKQINGLTITDNGDGTVTISGTAAADTCFIVEDQTEFTVPKGKYALSGGSNSTYLYVELYNGQTRVFQKRDIGESLLFDVTAQEYTGLRLFIMIPSGTVLQNAVVKPQLETGVAATDWEAYKSTAAEAETDTLLAQNEYIDFIGKKRVSGNAESDVTVTGGLLTVKSAVNTIICGIESMPEKIEVGYYQDINKVIAELKYAILSQGSNT